jgi:hypothetical protein
MTVTKARPNTCAVQHTWYLKQFSEDRPTASEEGRAAEGQLKNDDCQMMLLKWLMTRAQIIAKNPELQGTNIIILKAIFLEKIELT